MNRVVAVMTDGDGTAESIVQADDSLQATDQWYVARAAAEGDTLGQIKASMVKRGMTLWCPDSQSWLVVSHAVTANFPPTRTGLASKSVATIKLVAKHHEDSPTWNVDVDHDLIRRFPRQHLGPPQAEPISRLASAFARCRS